MSRLFLLAALFGLISSNFIPGQEAALEQTLALQQTLRKIISEAEPSIVCVLVSRSEAYGRLTGQAADSTGKLGDFDAPRFFGPAGPQEDRLGRRKLDLADPGHLPEAFGSGTVITADGLVLTNYHVIQGATKIFLRFPGGQGSYADIHAADPRSDLAVLRVRNKGVLPLRAIALGDASRIERGQFALTLANPFAAGFRDGLPSASWGIISNIRRRVPGQPREDERTKPLHYYGTLLQTDARLHLGCSGGALLNLKGELIGLTTALAAIHGGETPGGYALPLDAGLRRILQVLKRGEEVDYGFLGVGLGEQRGEPSKGVAVEHVTPGSPADLDGRLRIHDILLAVNEVAVHESDDLFLNLGTQLAGARITLKVLRAGGRDINNVEVTLGKFYVTGKKIASSLGNRPFFRGLRVDYTTLLVQQSPRLPAVPGGVLVSDVQGGTAAAQAGLKPGEVITHVNSRPVVSPAAFYNAVASLQGPIEFQLYNFGTPEPPSKVVLK